MRNYSAGEKNQLEEALTGTFWKLVKENLQEELQNTSEKQLELASDDVVGITKHKARREAIRELIDMPYIMAQK